MKRSSNSNARSSGI